MLLAGDCADTTQILAGRGCYCLPKCNSLPIDGQVWQPHSAIRDTTPDVMKVGVVIAVA